MSDQEVQDCFWDDYKEIEKRQKEELKKLASKDEVNDHEARFLAQNAQFVSRDVQRYLEKLDGG